MRHRVSLRQIEGFIAAGDLRSFRQASEALHVTQSAFSQMVRELESNVGVRLFDRTTRRVDLTPAGEAMHRKIKAGIEAIDDACDEARAVARLETGHLRIGTLSSVATGIVTRTLGQLRKRFPGIAVSMREDFNGILIEHVASGETDLSVCAQSATASADLMFEELFKDELLVVMRDDHPRARARAITWTALAGESLVMTMKHTSTREHVAASLAAHGIAKAPEIEVASMATALAMVRVGFGVTFVSRVALADLALNGLVARRMHDPALRRLGIYRRRGRTPSPASEKFAELLRAEAHRSVKMLRRVRRAGS